MKIRSGFVSNSSSSSFCIIGITSEQLIDEYVEAAGLDLNNLEEIGQGGIYSGGYFDLYGNNWEGEGDFDYAGTDAEELLKNMSIPKACKHVQKCLKQIYKLDIPLEEINFHYGEVSN